MSYYHKSAIFKGAFLTLDAPIDTPAYIQRSTPRAPRYGDQPFAEVYDRLDEVKARLEKLRDDLRAARK